MIIDKRKKENLLLLEMSALMILHVSFCSESLATQLACEWLFMCMSPHMNYQIRPLRKWLIARWKIASVGLSSIMDMLMCFKSTFARKTFRTSRIRTYETCWFLTACKLRKYQIFLGHVVAQMSLKLLNLCILVIGVTLIVTNYRLMHNLIFDKQYLLSSDEISFRQAPTFVLQQ